MGANTGVRSPAQRLLSVRQAVEGLRAELDEPLAMPLAIAVLTLFIFAIVRLTGGAPSAFMELGFVPVVLAASAYGRQGGLATGVAVAAALGPAPALLGFDRVEGPIEWLIRAATFGALGYLVAPGVERLGLAIAASPATLTPQPTTADPDLSLTHVGESLDADAALPPEGQPIHRPSRPAAASAAVTSARAAVSSARSSVSARASRTVRAAAQSVAAQTVSAAAQPVAAASVAPVAPAEVAAPRVAPAHGAAPPIPSDPDALVALARAAESRDMDGGEHLRRISLTSRRLAERAGQSPVQAHELGWAAMLHDLGKAQVPDRVLQKPEPLDADEWMIVRLHPMWGEEALGDGEQLALAREVARSHHENWDGTGYPDGRYGDQIPLAGRIVRITDAFDAMTNERPYQRPVSFEAALEELQASAGTDFDPALVPLFVELIRSDPALRADLTTHH